MLKVYYAEKGAGKTKRIIEQANKHRESAKGNVVFIDDNKNYSREIHYQIRFIDASEYQIADPQTFFGFICGIAAQDFDLEALYIDGFLKIVKQDLSTLDDFFVNLEKFCKKFNIDIMISVSGKGAAPEFLQPYLIA